MKPILNNKRKLRLQDRKRPLTCLDSIKLLVLQFSHLSAWSMVKSINVWSCFMKILSTSNNSWGQADWNSGQTEKVNFLYFIILSAHSLCYFHWLSFFTKKRKKKKNASSLIHHISIFSPLHGLPPLIVLFSLSLFLHSSLSLSLTLWIHMF